MAPPGAAHLARLAPKPLYRPFKRPSVEATLAYMESAEPLRLWAWNRTLRTSEGFAATMPAALVATASTILSPSARSPSELCLARS